MADLDITMVKSYNLCDMGKDKVILASGRCGIYEEDISAEGKKKKEDTRVSQPDGYRSRSPYNKKKACKREKKAVCMKNARLTKRRDFKEVYEHGKSVATRGLVLYYFANSSNLTKTGFVAGKKVGNAVIRNRVKRLLREVFRIHKDEIKSGLDLIFIARLPFAKYDYYQAAAEMKRILQRSGLLLVKKSNGDEL
jgi:ribonuclease P protein component